MAASWKECRWGDLATLEYGKGLRGYESGAGQFPVYGTNGLIGWHSDSLCKHPGVIIGRKGAYRGIHYSSGPFYAIDTAFYLRPKADIDLRWAYYALLTQDINAMDSGSAIPSTSRNDFYALPVMLPPLSEQRAIVRVLASLDDKIDLNRRMNETLETMARALFKSWFVDFDPVYAKAEGRQPYGISRDTADLFPNSFEDSQVGTIPRGWRAREIRTEAKVIQYGLTRSAATEPLGPHFLRITDIQGGRVDWNRVPYCPVSPEEHERYRIRQGDILVARTGASTGENIYIVDAPNSVFASYLVRIQFSDITLARVVGEFMRTATYFDFVAGAIGGSAQPNASAQLLASAPFCFPSLPVAERFAEIVEPLDKLRIENARQAQTLAAIRDSLLPKLISGEIRVNDAVIFVENSVRGRN